MVVRGNGVYRVEILPVVSLSRRLVSYIYTHISFLIDNIFIEFGGRIYQQTIGLPMGRNCVPLLAKLFLYSCEDYQCWFTTPNGKNNVLLQLWRVEIASHQIMDVILNDSLK